MHLLVHIYIYIKMEKGLNGEKYITYITLF